MNAGSTGICVTTLLQCTTLSITNSATVFWEVVCEEALELALKQGGFKVLRQVDTPIWFRGKRIGKYKADLIVNDVVLLELKAGRAVDREHEAQVLNYLRATDLEVALLLKFSPKPVFKRFVFGNERKVSRVHSRSAGTH